MCIRDSTYFSDEPQYAAVQALAENRTPMIKDTATARKLFGKEMCIRDSYAPHTVGEALKSAVYIAALYQSFGYDVTPKLSLIHI